MRPIKTALLLLIVGARAGEAQGSAASRLQVEVFGSQAQTFHVLTALVSGPTEAVLWDGQYRPADGARIADSIAARGKKLKAIVLSHADHDHWMGMLPILARFPGTPVYATPSVREDYAKRAANDLAQEKRRGGDVPDSLVVLQALSARLTVDGVRLEIMDGLTGDVSAPASAVMWIPSLRTVLAGDLVFSGIHAWLGDSDVASREHWRSDVRRLIGLSPAVVIPGHQRDLTTPRSPRLLEEMIAYLDTFDAATRSATAAPDVIAKMTTSFPDLALPVLMAAGARRHFAPPPR